jgi:agmatine deiminase
MSTPQALGYRLPAEWEKHVATWLSWPHNLNSWPGKFEPVPQVWADFVRIVSAAEHVHILAGQPEVYAQAQSMVGACKNVTIHRVKTNDAWIRDHGPMFLCHPEKPPALVDWEYNAWGGKYPPFDDDNRVPGQVAEFTQRQLFTGGMILEGGSIEPNGLGTLLVTSQCLLNPNRNTDWTKAQIEEKLRLYANVTNILWLGEYGDGSIAGDDTDAHIDQIARFVNANTILCAWQEDESAADYGLLAGIYEQLKTFVDQDGKPFNVIKLPLPDPIFYDGTQLPACYCNFYIANDTVIVPTFDCPNDERALEIIGKHFPTRKTIGQRAVDLVWGLGAFHCMTMQEVEPYSLG